MNADAMAFIGSLGLKDPAGTIAVCETLLTVLREGNERLNLTRILSEDDYWNKHICDSLAAVPRVPLRDMEGLQVADIGCGGGFPSLPLAAAFPKTEFTAVDSTGKKVAFVAEAAKKLRLDNVRPIQARAVEMARRPEFRSAFHFITARAVSNACSLLSETYPMLKPGGDAGPVQNSSTG